MNTFNDFSLPEFLVKSLEEMNITIPTPVQVEAIPPALEGKNILASAQTGTGKTIAYLIPLLIKLNKSPQEKALILTPTRELAIQVQDAARRLLGRPSPFNMALLIGGEPMPKQLSQLRRNPRLIIGTPGRINDLLNRSLLHLETATFFVLDEVDRMLDMGFAEQLEDIVKNMPEVKDRQTLMFSATLPKNIERLAQKYLDNPHRVSIGVENQPVAKIKQDIIYASNSEKFNLLSKELDEREGFIIVFVKTKHRADQLAVTLKDKNHNVQAIHGGLRQQKRERVIKDFRDRKSRIVIATDIAARGLDVPHIQHVINYDLPQCPEDYLHRIGRTGRAGAEGSALSLIAPDEEHKWRAISRMITDHEFESSGFSRGSSAPRGGGSSSPRSFGNRSPRGGSFGGPKRSFSREGRGESSESSFGDKPRRSFGEGSDRPRRSFGENSDRPRRSFGEGSDSPRPSFGDNADRPRRSFGENSDRPRRSFGENSDRPRPSFGDNADRPRRSFGENSDRPRPSFGDNADRPRRSFGENSDRPRPSFGANADRPRRSFGENSDRPRPSFGENSDRPRPSFGENSDRPRRSGGFSKFGGNSNRSHGSGDRSFTKSFGPKNHNISES